MKRQRTLGFKPVSKKVRFIVTMPLTGVLSQFKGGGGSPLKFWKTRFRDNG